MIVVEDVSRGVFVLRVGKEDVDDKVAIMSVLLRFDVDKPLKILAVNYEVLEITICRNLDSGSFITSGACAASE